MTSRQLLLEKVLTERARRPRLREEDAMNVLVLDERQREAECHRDVKVRKLKGSCRRSPLTLLPVGVEQVIIPPLTIHAAQVKDTQLGFLRKACVPVTYPALRVTVNPSSLYTVHKVTYPARTFCTKGTLERPDHLPCVCVCMLQGTLERHCECEVPERTLSFLHPAACRDRKVAKTRTAFHQVSVSEYRVSGFLMKSVKATGVILAATNVRIEIDLGELSKHFRFDEVSLCGADFVGIGNDVTPSYGYAHVS